MKYLDKAPFSGRANTPEFDKGYDQIVWDKGKCPRCGHAKHVSKCTVFVRVGTGSDRSVHLCGCK